MSVNFASAAGANGVRQIRYTDLPDPIPNKFDKNGFAKVLRAMKGGKSVREFSITVDLSESFISKAINGVMDRSPTKRTLLKLLCTKTATPADRKELFRVAGYPEDAIDILGGDLADEDRKPISLMKVISHYAGANSYLAIGRLMEGLAEHGVTGDVSSYFYRNEGYFEIKDEDSGQVYIGINAYCETGATHDDAFWPVVFSLGSIFHEVTSRPDIDQKVVVIMTNDDKLFDVCKSLGPQKNPKAAVVLLMDDDGFQRENVFLGTSPISFLD